MRKTFGCHAHFTSPRAVDYMGQLVKKGHDAVPPKLPTMKSQQSSWKLQSLGSLGFTVPCSEPVAAENFKEDDGSLECVEFEEVPDSTQPSGTSRLGSLLRASTRGL